MRWRIVTFALKENRRMGGPWILMMMLTAVAGDPSGHGRPVSLSGVEFSSKESCQFGAEQMLKKFDEHVVTYGVIWTCVPK